MKGVLEIFKEMKTDLKDIQMEFERANSQFAAKLAVCERIFKQIAGIKKSIESIKNPFTIESRERLIERRQEFHQCLVDLDTEIDEARKILEEDLKVND